MKIEADTSAIEIIARFPLHGEGGQLGSTRHELAFPFPEPIPEKSGRAAGRPAIQDSGLKPPRKSSSRKARQSDTVAFEGIQTDSTALKPVSNGGAGDIHAMQNLAGFRPGTLSPRKRGRGGQVFVPHQQDNPAAQSFDDGQVMTTEHAPHSTIESGDGQVCPTHHTVGSVAATLHALYGRRDQWLNARMRLILQGKAIARRYADGDKTAATKLFNAIRKGDESTPDLATAIAPIIRAIDMFDAEIAPVEKVIAKTAKQHHLWPVAEGISGLGAVMFAGFVYHVGQGRSFAAFTSVKALYRLFSIGLNPDGTRQRLVAGEGALAQKYNPKRRAFLYNVSECILKAQIRAPKDEEGDRIKDAPSVAIGPLGQVYLDRKAHELSEANPLRVETPGHAHKRAARMVAKAIIRQLYEADKAHAAS